MVFLAAGTWLGWEVISGRAQAFLSAIGHGSPGSATGNGGGGGGGHPPPISGPLAGVGFSSLLPDVLPTTAPTVFSDVFGQNGSLNSPGNSGPYGLFSPNYGGAYDPLLYTQTPTVGGMYFNL